MQLVKLSNLIHLYYLPFSIYKSFLVRPSQFESNKILAANEATCMSLNALPDLFAFTTPVEASYRLHIYCHIKL